MAETQHQAFLRGFGDALGITDPLERDLAWKDWLVRLGASVVEAIDLETEGYAAGLEAGRDYLQMKE